MPLCKLFRTEWRTELERSNGSLSRICARLHFSGKGASKDAAEDAAAFASL